MDRGVHDRVHHLSVLNPFRSEQDAFKVFLYIGGFFIALAVIVVVARAL